MKSKLNLVVTSIIVLGIATRFIPHPPNFTAIGAIALFGGAYFTNKRMAIFVPLIILFISDMLMELITPGFGIHKTIPFVYGSFILISLLGILLRTGKKPISIMALSVLSSVLFFAISNFGSWLVFYPQTAAGLSACYIAAIPFFHWNVIGDLVFNGIFFTAAYFIFQKYPALSTSNE
jgi:hypothetical protein